MHGKSEIRKACQFTLNVLYNYKRFILNIKNVTQKDSKTKKAFSINCPTLNTVTERLQDTDHRIAIVGNYAILKRFIQRSVQGTISFCRRSFIQCFGISPALQNPRGRGAPHPGGFDFKPTLLTKLQRAE